MKKLYVLSLGCARNLVDSEVLQGLFKEKDFVIVDDPVDADLAIVNTCGFIQEAKQEVIKNNRGIDNYKILLRNYTNMYLTANTKHGKYYPLNQLIIEKIDEFKKYPFLDISSIKNNFNHDNCSYTRAISYDIESKVISVKEKNDYNKRF